MSIKVLLELSINSIERYTKLVESHNSKKEYGSDIVSAYNVVGENLEALSDCIDEIFSNDRLYEEHFESDDIQDYLSEELERSFEEYKQLKQKQNCEEKITLAYEWLFELTLFTIDDEELKSRITLDKTGIELIPSKKVIDYNTLKEGDKVVITIYVSSKREDISLEITEIVDDYIYGYIGDKDDEDDLIIFNADKIIKVI